MHFYRHSVRVEFAFSNRSLVVVASLVLDSYHSGSHQSQSMSIQTRKTKAYRDLNQAFNLGVRATVVRPTSQTIGCCAFRIPDSMNENLLAAADMVWYRMVPYGTEEESSVNWRVWAAMGSNHCYQLSLWEDRDQSFFQSIEMPSVTAGGIWWPFPQLVYCTAGVWTTMEPERFPHPITGFIRNSINSINSGKKHVVYMLLF